MIVGFGGDPSVNFIERDICSTSAESSTIAATMFATTTLDKFRVANTEPEVIRQKFPETCWWLLGIKN